MISNNKNQMDQEKLKKEALREYIESSQQLQKERKKKFIIISSVIIVFVVIIKIFFGTIELYNVLGLPSSNGRYYKLTINGEQIGVAYTLKRKIPIIPYLINFNSVYLGNSDIVGNDTGPNFYSNGSENYTIKLNSYKCYYNDIQVECKTNDQTMKKVKDEKFKKMVITRISNPYGEVLYDGEMIENIAPYVKDKGIYHIGITSKYGLNESEIYFYFKNLKKEN